MDIKDNKQLIISVMVMSLGLLMILGTSYSLIRKTYSSNEAYSLTVGNIEVNFSHENNNTITLSNTYPVSDIEGINGENAFSFSVNNTGSYTANYKISIEETSKNKIGEVIRFSYNLNNTGYTKVSTLSENNIVAQNMVLNTNETDEYEIKFWIKEDALTSYMDQTFSAKIVLDATQNEYKYATTVIELLANMKKDGVYAINKDGTLGDNDIREYRYIGNDVSNYVWFNCDDGYTRGNKHCEKWRIIGSFDNTWENGINIYKSLKIVKDGAIDTKIPFNNDAHIGDYETSYLNYYANNTYYNKLSLGAKNMILTARYHIGKVSDNSNIKSLYNSETSNIMYLDVGSLNLSDYLYAEDTLNGNWLNTFDNKVFTMNTSLNNSKQVNLFDSSGVSLGDYHTDYSFVPTVYLKPDVSIISGYGTLDSPYEVDIRFPMSYGTVEEIR